jgi:hypothetical protein
MIDTLWRKVWLSIARSTHIYEPFALADVQDLVEGLGQFVELQPGKSGIERSASAPDLSDASSLNDISVSLLNGLDVGQVD